MYKRQASNVLEGKVIVMIDNSPSVLILPTTFFDFVQEAQDYYLPPITGSYLRLIRIMVFFLTLFVTPIWYYLNCNPDFAPEDVYKRQFPNSVAVANACTQIKNAARYHCKEAKEDGVVQFLEMLIKHAV